MRVNRLLVVLVAGVLIVAYALSSLAMSYFATTTIYVANRDIEPFTEITQDMLVRREVHAKFGGTMENAITDPEQVVGKIARVRIFAGNPIFTQQVASPDEIHQFALNRPSDDQRFVTVPADFVSSLGGRIEPGMRLDIWAIYRPPDQPSSKIIVLVENALVVDTHSQREDAVEAITFALNPLDALKVALAGHEGRLYFALPGENPVPSNLQTPLGLDDVFSSMPMGGRMMDTGGEVNSVDTGE